MAKGTKHEYPPKCDRCKGTHGKGCKASKHRRPDWDAAMERFGKPRGRVANGLFHSAEETQP